MANPRGNASSLKPPVKGERRGGRKKGTPNKANQEHVVKARALGMLPHEFLAAIARGDDLPGVEGVTLDQRIRCAESAAPFFAAKKREITGPGGGPLQVFDYSKLSKDQLRAFEPLLASLIRPGA